VRLSKFKCLYRTCHNLIGEILIHISCKILLSRNVFPFHPKKFAIFVSYHYCLQILYCGVDFHQPIFHDDLMSCLLNDHQGHQILFECWYIPNIWYHFLSNFRKRNFHWTFSIRCVFSSTKNIEFSWHSWNVQRSHIGKSYVEQLLYIRSKHLQSHF